VTGRHQLTGKPAGNGFAPEVQRMHDASNNELSMLQV
jgi:hypothetical protein